MTIFGLIVFYLVSAGLAAILEVWISGGKFKDAVILFFWLPAVLFIFATIVLIVPLVILDRLIHLGQAIGRKLK